MFALFFLVLTVLTFDAPPIEVSREVGIPYYFSDVQLLWVYPKPIIPKGEISLEETVRHPVYGVAYYDDSARIIKYEKHEAGKTEWMCSYTYDDASRHKTSECSETGGSTRYLIYDDRGVIVRNIEIKKK